MAKTRINSYEELWKMACQITGEMMEECRNDIDWESVPYDSKATIADIMERRLIGADSYTMEMARAIRAAGLRLEHVEESPRKKAAQAFLEMYKGVFEEHLEKKAEMEAMITLSSMLTDPSYEIPRPVRVEASRKGTEADRVHDQFSQDLFLYNTMFESFFKGQAIGDREPTDISEIRSEKRVFERLNRFLPQGEDMAPFRQRGGYVAQASLDIRPRSVTMVMEPNAVTDMTVDNYVARIRTASPKRVDREWGFSTFDNMMAGIYNDDELRAIKQSGRSFLETVFIDGKSVRELYGMKNNESRQDYENRIKCEIVACALEGKGKIDICPFERQENGFVMRDPIPMRVKVNLKEEVPIWKRALRFFHIKSETKKERAERISMDDLQAEERQGRIRQQVAALRERERSRQMAAREKQQREEALSRDEELYFGFMGDSVDKRSEAIRKGLTVGSDQIRLLDTMDRFDSRVNFARSYALTKGLTLEQVLSDDPALAERKREIGRELMEQYGLVSREEYVKTQGSEANYDAYLQEKKTKAFETLQEMHRQVLAQPYQPMADTRPETLAVHYQENAQMRSFALNIIQCTSHDVRNVNRPEFDSVSNDFMRIGEIGYGAPFVEYMATDAYVWPHAAVDGGEVAGGVFARAAMEQYQKDLTRCRTYGDAMGQIALQRCTGTTKLRADMAEFISAQEKNFYEAVHYAESGANPVSFFDQSNGMFTVKGAKEISEMLRQADKSWQDEFEEISKPQIQNSGRRVRMREQKVSKEEAARQDVREQERQMMENTIENHIQFQKRDDQAYFGFLGEDDAAIRNQMAGLTKFQEDGNEYYTLNTMGRQSSRINVVRAYAMMRGMSLEEVLSGDPALNERKAKIGKEFVEKITMLSKEEYGKLQGSDAGYEEYRAEKKEEIFKMAREMHPVVLGISYEPLADIRPETLAASYEKGMFIRNISQDFEQSFKIMGIYHKDEMNAMTDRSRAMGQFKCLGEYCKFLASDSYVRPDTMEQTDVMDIVNAMVARESLKNYVKSTRECRSCADLSAKIDEQTAMAEVLLTEAIHSKASGSKEGYRQVAEDLTVGTEPEPDKQKRPLSMERKKQGGRFLSLALLAFVSFSFSLLFSGKAVTAYGASGWQQQEDGWYYYNVDGGVKTGWIMDKGKGYYLDENGLCAVDTITPDGYYVDGSGAWWQREASVLDVGIKAPEKFLAPEDLLEGDAIWHGQGYIALVKGTIENAFGGKRTLQVQDGLIEYLDRETKEPVMALYRNRETGEYRLDLTVDLEPESRERSQAATYDYQVFRALLYQFDSVPDVLEQAIVSAWNGSNRWGINRQGWVRVADCQVNYMAGVGYGSFRIRRAER